MTDLIVSHSDFRALDRSVVRLPDGLTLRQLVDAAVTDPVLRGRAVVEVAGEILPPEVWGRVRPKPGTHVAVRARAHGGGGGGGGKNPLRTILTIAVVAAAAWIAPYAAYGLAQAVGAGWTAGGTFIASSGFLSIAAPLIAGGITMIGAALVNAIAPPPTPKLSRLSGAASARPESPALSIAGAQNRSNPYGVVPRVYGRHRMFPLYAAQPFTVQEGDDQILYLLFDFGLGPLALDDLRIGENPLGQFEGVETVIHERFTPQTELQLYRNDVQQDGYQIALTEEGGPQVVESASDADEVAVEITFQGLTRYNDAGNRTTRTVDMRVEYRPAGSVEPWTPILDYDNATDETAATVTDVPDGRYYSVYRTDELTTGTVDLSLTIPATWRGSGYIWGVKYAIYTRSEGESAWQRQVNTGWVVVNSSYPSALNAQTKTVNHTLTGERGKRMEIRVERTRHSVWGVNGSYSYMPANSGGQGALPAPMVAYKAPKDDITFSGATSQALRKAVTIRPGRRDRWEVRVTRLTADSTSTRVQDSAFLTAVRSVTFRRQVAFTETHTLVEMKIKATDQLNGVVSQFSAIATSILPVWDGAAWAEAETRNPAWVFADILRGSGNARPVSDDRLDLAGLKAWAEACDAQAPQSALPDAVAATGADPTWTCDMVVDYRTTVFELLRDVAATGRAAFAQPDGRFSVVRDVAQDVPVQMFTPRNSWGFRGVKTFTDLPHGLKCRFVSPEKDWQQDEVIAYADGYSAATASRFETLELLGCTRASQAWREGRYQLAVGQLRPETFELQADIEALACTRGDLVVVAHDVPMLGGVAARVQALTLDGSGKVAALALDEAFGMEAGASYALRGRHADGSFSMHSLETVAGESHEVRLATAVAPASAPDVGDLVVVGPAQRVTAEMIVKDVQPGPDLTARLVLVDAAPAVHSADTSPIPLYDPQIVRSLSAPPPPAEGPSLAEEVEQVGREVRSTLIATWRQPAGTASTSWEVYRWTAATGWVSVSVVSAPRAEVPAVIGVENRVAVVAVGLTGAKRPVEDAPRAGMVPSGRLDTPATPGGLRVSPNGFQARLEWAPVTLADAYEVTIRRPRGETVLGGQWGTEKVITTRALYATFDTPLAGTYDIELRAVNLQGLRSATPAKATVEVSEPFARNNVYSHTLDTAAGTLSGAACLGSDGSLRRPSIKGSAAGSFATDDDCGLQNYGWGLEDVPGTDLAAVPGTWFSAMDLDEAGRWESAVIDMGAELSGALTVDFEAEVLTYEQALYWQEMGGEQMAALRGADLEATGGGVTVYAVVGNQPDLSDGQRVPWGMIRARYARVVVEFAEASRVVEQYVRGLVLTVDAPDVQDQGTHTLATASDTVAFTRTFRAAPSVVISGVGGSAPDLQSVTADGFTVSGSAGDSFNWYAKGY